MRRSSTILSRAMVPALAMALLAVRASAVIATYTLQPSPGYNDGSDDGSATRGKDTSGVYPYSNGGASPVLYNYNSPCNAGLFPSYIQFSLVGLPTASVSKAEIKIYCYVYFNGAGWPWDINPQLSVRRVTEPWNEMTVSPSSFPAANPTVYGSQTVATVGGGGYGSAFVEFEGWLTFNVTSLYTNWAAGIYPNYGVQFAIDNSTCVNGDEFEIYSSDNPSPDLRPQLIVTGTAPPPPLTVSRNPGNSLQISWLMPTGLVSQMQYSTNLTNWLPYGAPIPATTNLLTLAVPMTNAACFYRVLPQ